MFQVSHFIMFLLKASGETELQILDDCTESTSYSVTSWSVLCAFLCVSLCVPKGGLLDCRGRWEQWVTGLIHQTRDHLGMKNLLPPFKLLPLACKAWWIGRVSRSDRANVWVHGPGVMSCQWWQETRIQSPPDARRIPTRASKKWREFLIIDWHGT